MLEFSEHGNEVVFGNAINKNMVRAEVHISSHVWSLSTYSGARDGCKPSYFLSNWEIQEGVFLCFEQVVTYGRYSYGSTIKVVGDSFVCVS